MKPRIGKGNQRRRAMTLLETVIAVSIFGTFVASAVVLITQARRMSDKARMHYQAINIGKNRLERAKTIDFGQLELLSESEVRVDSGGNPDPEGDFQRSTTVTNISGNLKEVIVNVGIMNRIQLDFTGEGQEIRSYYTEYYEP